MKALKEINWRRLDLLTIVIMGLLLAVGLYCIKQADIASGSTEELYSKQMAGVVIGLAMIFVIVFIDYRFLCKYSIIFYVVTLAVLGYTLKFGVNINNVRRWVKIAGIQLQPSELAKVVLILFLAFLCNALKEKMDKFYTLFILGAAAALPVILILMQPHLSTSLVIVIIFATMVYMSGISYKIIGTVIALALPVIAAVIIGIGVYEVDVPLIKPYQVKRIMSYLSSDESEDTKGKFQQNQAVTAIASGEKEGKLLSDDSSTRAYNGIYAKESDFVFSIVGEEFGFIGSAIIILLYFIMVIRCLYIGAHAPDYMGRMICAGVSAMLMFQVFINVGVATSLLPNTGLPLPFISYGLTSLINSMAGVGIVLNVGLRTR